MIFNSRWRQSRDFRAAEAKSDDQENISNIQTADRWEGEDSCFHWSLIFEREISFFLVCKV